ncbi:c6 zinc finger domain-containing protein [Colletotrichum tabaci]|uniref:C6 zinc finger domain-containing protein n=1 Tax=Colletotrichum tabaci TaxID=1209068 RepID=A0AAV9T9X4_9PEZI
MDERPSKKRKVRKGTRSCWQCRKRKIRCEFTSNEEQTCNGCKSRGTTCVSQEFNDDEPSGPPERGLAQRLGRLEELMVKLADKIGPEASIVNSSSNSSNSNISNSNSNSNSNNNSNNNNSINTPTSSVDGSLRSSEFQGTPDNSSLVSATVTISSSTPGDVIPETRTPQDRPSRSGSKYEKVCRELHSAFPSPEDAKTIVHSSRGPIFLLAMFYSYQDILDGNSPATAALTVVPDVNKHPAILARKLLQLTICLQQLPPSFDSSKLELGLKGSIQDKMNEWAAVAGLVTSNEELLGSAEGLECLILLGFYLLNSGNLRKAWLVMRRALSLAQLMGIEGDLARPLKSCDPATDTSTIPASQTFWYRINFCDRYISLLLGLSAGTQDNSFLTDEFLVRDTPMERLEKRYTAIALRIIERNRAPAHEAYAITQSVDCELENAAKSMGRSWWEIPSLMSHYTTDTPAQMGVMSHLMLQIHHHSLLILLHLPYMLRNQTNSRFDYSKNTCLESSRAVLRRCVIFRTANDVAFSCRHIDYSSLMASMTLLLGHLSRPPGVREEDWSRQRNEDRALAVKVVAKMEELALLNDDKLSGESADIIRKLLPIVDCCNGMTPAQFHGEEARNLQLVIPYLGVININTTTNQAAESCTVDLSHSQLLTPTNTATTTTTAAAVASETYQGMTPPELCADALLGQDNTIPHEDPSAGLFSTDCLEGWSCPGITAEAGDWTFQGVDTTYWSLLNSGMACNFTQ